MAWHSGMVTDDLGAWVCTTSISDVSSTRQVARSRTGALIVSFDPAQVITDSRGVPKSVSGTGAGTVAVTTSLNGATVSNGFLRGPSGALVVTADTAGARYRDGALRSPEYALVVYGLDATLSGTLPGAVAPPADTGGGGTTTTTPPPSPSSITLAAINDTTQDTVLVDVTVAFDRAITVEYQLDGTAAPWVAMDVTGPLSAQRAVATVAASAVGAHNVRVRVGWIGGSTIVGPEAWDRLPVPTGGGGADIVPVDAPITFDTTNYKTVPVSNFVYTGDIDIRCAVTPTGITGGTSEKCIFSLWDADLLKRNFQIGIVNDGTQRLAFFGSDLNDTAILLQNGVRYELRFKYVLATNTASIYVNGTLQATGTCGPFSPVGTPVAVFGARKADGTEGFVGTLHWFVYNNVQFDVAAAGLPAVPVTTISLASQPAWDSAQINVSATNTPTGYFYKLDGGTATAFTPTAGKFTFTGLAAGTHNITVWAVNANGTGASVSLSVTATPPASANNFMNLRLDTGSQALLVNQQGTFTTYKLAQSTAPRGDTSRSTKYTDATFAPTSTSGVLRFVPTIDAGLTNYFGVLDPVLNDWSPPDPSPEPAITAPGSIAGGGSTSSLIFGITGGNIAADQSWQTAAKLGVKYVRMELPIGANPATYDTVFANYASRGIRVLLLLGFPNNKAMPTDAEAQNVGNWAARFGMGGTFWTGRTDGAFGVKLIEFGNETSMSYKMDHTSGAAYATQFLKAYNAIQAKPNGTQVGLLYEMGSEWPDWYTASYTTIPNLHTKAAGWTVHPYGVSGDVTKGSDLIITRMRTNLNSAGGVSARDHNVHVTEWGCFTDDGNAMVTGNWYGFSNNYTYAQAKTVIQARCESIAVSFPQVKTFFFYQGNDARVHGASTNSEDYYGLLKNDLTDKPSISAYYRTLNLSAG